MTTEPGPTTQPAPAMEIDSAFYQRVLDGLHDGIYFVDQKRIITFWNRAAEGITGYAHESVVGRSCSDGILSHTDDTGRLLCGAACPLDATLEDGQPREANVYLHHRAGHRVPTSLRAAPIVSADGAIVGVVETFSDDSARVSAVERANEMERLAYVDALTALPNRRYAEATLSARFNEMRRFGWTFGVIFLDIDHFKQINDTYTHEVGDRVLAMVAKTLVTNVRSFDVVSRWGGEEFVCIVGHVDQSQLETVAEKLRALVERSNLTLGDTQIGVTISAGATQAQITDSAELLIERADRLMYLSKTAGRNRVSGSLGRHGSGST